MISSRDVSRFIGIVGKAGREFVIEPGLEVGVSAYNLGLPENQRFTYFNDVEHSHLPTAMFFQPFAWPSIGVGIASGVVIGSVADTFKSGLAAFGTVYNLGLNADERLQGSDDRNAFRIFGPQAWPGIIVGAALGFSVDFVVDTARSFGSSFTSLYNAGLPATYKIVVMPDLIKDTRHTARIYATGLLGILSGGITGVLATAVTDTYHSIAPAFVSVYNAGLDDTDSIAAQSLNKDSRHGIKKYFSGIFGLLIGGLAGTTTTIAADNAKSFGNTIAAIYNTGLAAENQMACLSDFAHSTRAPIKKYVIGLVGILTGGIAGIFVTALADTCMSLETGFSAIYDLGTSTEEIAPTTNSRHAFKKYCVGILGILVGGLVGAVSLIIVNNFQSLGNAFASIYNAGLKPSEALLCINDFSNDLRSPFKKYVLGIVGVLLGSLAGVVATFAADTLRSLSNTYVSIYNAGLEESQKIHSHTLLTDTRHWFKKYVVGLFGIMSGSIAGSIATICVDTKRSLLNAFTSVYNTGLADDEKISSLSDFESDTRHAVKKYVLGAFGVLIGGLLGVCVTTICDNARSLINSFASVYNAGLAPENQITVVNDFTHDSRHAIKKYVVGIIGTLIGGVAGIVVTTFADTLHSMLNAFASVYNTGLTADEQITFINDFAHSSRHVIKKYAVGAVGALIGGVTGSIVTFAADTVRSFGNSVTSIYNLGLHSDAQITCLSGLNQDSRHGFKKYAIGVLGLLTGGIIGSFITVVTDTVLSLATAYTSVYNTGLSGSEKLTSHTLASDTRHGLKKYGIGVFGILVGGLIGAVITTLTDNVRSFSNAFISIYNAGLVADEQIKALNSFENDSRHGLKKYGIGMLGMLSGSIVGAVNVFIMDTVLSAKSTFITICNAGLHDSDKITCLSDFTHDKRHDLKKYGIGMLGLIVGALPAIPAVFIVDTVQSAFTTFVSLVNKALPKKHRIKQVSEIQHDPRHPIKKYGTGLLGVLVGGLFGGVVAGMIACTRFCTNTVSSYKALSGSIMNVALERQYFAGLGAEKSAKTLPKMLARGIGYTAATLTTGIFGIGVFTIRKTPGIIVATLAIALTPITVIVKAFTACCTAPRFPAMKEESLVEQAFKELFSSVDNFGRLYTGQTIQAGTDGSEKTLTTVRKCLTLNSKTPTEVTLEGLLAAYRANPGIAFFTGPAFDAAVENIKSEYRNDCFLGQSQIRTFCQEIDDVAKFARKYITDAKKTVKSDFYSKRSATWSELFFTKAPSMLQRAKNQLTELTSPVCGAN